MSVISHTWSYWRHLLFVCFIGNILMILSPLHVIAEGLLPFQIANKPFSPTMCKKTMQGSYIRIVIAKHQDLVIRKVPGQYIPRDLDEARKKDYVHYITLSDLTNGHIVNGAIAFDTHHGIIFQNSHPDGISRPEYLAQQDLRLRPLVNQALNTFVHLHPILNAAIDACRPYPAKIAYETDDELLRIETGKHTYQNLVHRHNHRPVPKHFVIRYETGKVGGFVDPNAGKDSNVSYQAMNPLNFYVPTMYP